MVADIKPAERESVIVPRSRQARGSSPSERGSVDVLGEAGRLDARSLDDAGSVTRIVGGWFGVVSFPDGLEMLM